MKHNTKRGFLATVSAVATAAALTLGGALGAHAAVEDPNVPVPERSEVTITKLEQPAELGSPATGVQDLEIDTSAGIAEVVFDYYLVHETDAGQGNDIGTNAGQEHAAGLTPATAQVDDEPTGSFDPTGADGATTDTLDRGLYLVQEDPTSLPAGVTAAAPFLLAVPLTHPGNLNQWLEHIYVYPKSSLIAGSKTVTNSGAHQLTVGSNVTWSISADIPRIQNPGGDAAYTAPEFFRIDDTLDDSELAYVSATVTAGDTELTENTHYEVNPEDNGNGTTTQQVEFTESGRAELAAAVNADSAAQVTVDMVATVLKAGVIENSAVVYPNADALANGGNPLEIASAQVRYGTLDVTKTSGAADDPLPGAEFRVYATAADAEKRSDNYLNVSPTGATGEGNDIWTTDTNGELTISGLRASDFADNEVLGTDDGRYQTYYLVEVAVPAGHQLLAEPVEFTLDSDKANLDIALDVTNTPNQGGFLLPLTGGMGTTLLTIAGLVLLAAVLIAARRRRAAAVSVE
jgi:fimbrial isopeptide formation D2 family protein/LPXTG-motif cell wall-anchored protein